MKEQFSKKKRGLKQKKTTKGGSKGERVYWERFFEKVKRCLEERIEVMTIMA